MAKSVEQRTQELTDPSDIAGAWAGISGKFKELNAPIFKKNGDIAAVAKRYDGLTKTFLDAVEKKDDVSKIADAGGKQAAASASKIGEMKGEIDKVWADEKQSRKAAADPKTPEEIFENFDELVKVYRDVITTRKSVFDNILKLSDQYIKGLTDTRDKIKKALDASGAVLSKANAELDATEGQIRKMVVAYQKVAFAMDRRDIADAVRQLLLEFGK